MNNMHSAQNRSPSHQSYQAPGYQVNSNSMETYGHGLQTKRNNYLPNGNSSQQFLQAQQHQTYPSPGNNIQDQYGYQADAFQQASGFSSQGQGNFTQNSMLPHSSSNQSLKTYQTNGVVQTIDDIVEPNGPILGGLGYIPAQTTQKAYYELGETPEIKAACIRGLRQLIEIHQEENNFDDHTDAFLLKFLRHRKFDVEGAYSLLQKYYNNRENKPEVFRNLTKKNVKRTLEQSIVGVLPQRDRKGRAIIIFNFSGWNMSLPFHFEKLLRVFVFTLEKLFESEETQINGVVIICDLSQLSVFQTKSLGSAMISKVVEIFQGNFPFRVSATHLLNPPWHFKLLWKMADPLAQIKLKMAQRIFIHDGDLSRFYNEFSKDILPQELGGSSPSYDNKLWIKELLEPIESTSVSPLHPPLRQVATMEHGTPTKRVMR